MTRKQQFSLFLVILLLVTLWITANYTAKQFIDSAWELSDKILERMK